MLHLLPLCLHMLHLLPLLVSYSRWLLYAIQKLFASVIWFLSRYRLCHLPASLCMTSDHIFRTDAVSFITHSFNYFVDFYHVTSQSDIAVLRVLVFNMFNFVGCPSKSKLHNLNWGALTNVSYKLVNVFQSKYWKDLHVSQSFIYLCTHLALKVNWSSMLTPISFSLAAIYPLILKFMFKLLSS